MSASCTTQPVDFLDGCRSLPQVPAFSGEAPLAPGQRILKLETELEGARRQIAELEMENERLRGINQWLLRRVFGQQSEKRKDAEDTTETATDSTAAEVENSTKISPTSINDQCAHPGTKKRGGQLGHQGHGRRIPKHLPTEERRQEIPQEQRQCEHCGLPSVELPMTEDSYEIDVRVQYVLVVNRRKKYKPACTCDITPTIMTAPSPAKVIPKGKFTAAFWAKTIVDKYLLQLPIQRQTLAMRLSGLWVPKSTLIGGFNTLAPLFSPLYKALVQLSQEQRHWHIDETRWHVFAESETKNSHRWWLWVFASQLTVCYVLDPSRSKAVPQEHLGTNVSGILSVDRYAAYKSLAKTSDTIILAFCWSHTRRDFDRLVDRYKNHRTKQFLAEWANQWIDKIANLYLINNARVAAINKSQEFEVYHQQLVTALCEMEAESKEDYSHWEQKKVMTSLQNHWQGLTVFVEHPEIPMDNNHSERCLRNPALGRNNYYGHHSRAAGEFAAMQFSIIQTCLLHGINPNAYLAYYLQACAQQNKAPDHIDDFLPHRIKERASRGDWVCQKLLINHIGDDP